MCVGIRRKFAKTAVSGLLWYLLNRKAGSLVPVVCVGGFSVVVVDVFAHSNGTGTSIFLQANTL